MQRDTQSAIECDLPRYNERVGRIIAFVCLLVAFVFAARVARFEHRHPHEGGQIGLDSIPEPARKILAGGIFEAGNLSLCPDKRFPSLLVLRK